jgi:uncharacterized integral membrane protein
MRRIILIVLLFFVGLFFVVFLGLNWAARFNLNLGFGSESVEIPVIIWTLGAFLAGAVCTSIVFLINILKRSRKAKQVAAENSSQEKVDDK